MNKTKPYLEGEVRKNNNFERLFELSARLKTAWDSAEGQKKDDLEHILDYINGKYFQSVEETDFPPEGELTVDDLINQSEKLLS